jgi:parallel beta-helix repeat protein
MEETMDRFRMLLLAISSLHLRQDPSGSAGQGRRRRLVAALGAGMLLLGMGAAHAENINSCPVTITKPGTYNVNKDLVCNTNGNAITISADNVTLNLKGHILLGPQTGLFTSTGVSVGAQQNVIVENGTITGFSYGVLLQGSAFSTVSGIAARGNTNIGIYVASGHNNTLSGCNLSRNPQGIVCYGAVGTIANNTANSNGSVGIFVGGTLIMVQGNTANSNGSFGIYVAFSGATSNTVRGNTVEFNGGAGILVFGSQNTIESNTALGNYGFDLDDFNLACDSNTWLNNTFVTRSQTCIH